MCADMDMTIHCMDTFAFWILFLCHRVYSCMMTWLTLEHLITMAQNNWSPYELLAAHISSDQTMVLSAALNNMKINSFEADIKDN